MHRLILALVLALAACAAPAPTGTFRPAGGPIWSNAVTDLSRIEGRWTQVANFAEGARPGCAPGGATITRQGDGLAIAARLCLDGAVVTHSGPFVVTGPGRLTASGTASPPLDEAWWLLWIDTDVRTLVIGTPSGRFGFILNRDGRLPGDRLTAAREILDWNGYDITRLRVFD